MSAITIVALFFGASAVTSGWFMWQGSRAKLSGAALLAGGILTIAGCAADELAISDVAPALFRTGGCLAVPMALMLYPRPRWNDPLTFVLTVVVGSGGALATIWPDAVQTVGFVTASALLVHIWWGLEQGDARERRALAWSSLAWISAGLIATFAGFVQESAGPGEALDIGAVSLALGVVGPPAMVIGVLRPELVDVRGLVTRAVVAGTVLTTYIAVAIGLASVGEELRGRPLELTPVVVMCALLAFGVHPLTVMLRGVVDQLLFGDRPDALTAATSLADRIGDDPALALDAIREALVLPYASLRVGDQALASSGSEVTHNRRLPLRLGGDVLGEVVVGLRPGDLRLSSSDEDVLRIVAPLLAQTLRARALAQELKESRGAAITAIEDERLRLRRDLHDGLGPTLTGVAFSADAARNQIRSAPDRAEALLETLRVDTAGAIAEIRRLVEGLRPPALDELGMLGAIRQHASALHTDGGALLQVTIDTPQSLPTLSAAAEVAAYRIVVESLTNVARHASATKVEVSISSHDGKLHLSVQDNGSSRKQWKPGVGLSSMRERAEQVGGSVVASARRDGGRVDAVIPL